MTVTLTQTDEAAFPDRNPGGRGLRVAAGPGLAGSRIELSIPQGTPSLHSRFVAAFGGLGGGPMGVSGVHAHDGQPLWTLDCRPADQTLTVLSPHAPAVSGTWSAALTWACVEVGYDPAGGELSLWIDGRAVGSSPLSASAPTPGMVWLGGLQKSPDTTGVLDFDEWVHDTAYIGPVRVAPAGVHADDPARWLVVFNRSVPDSIHWAEAYRAARGVPYGHLLGLDLPTAETIDAASYESLRAAIADYLDRNGLRTQVMGLLLGYGVPGYVAHPTAALPVAVASLLQTDSTGLSVSYRPDVTDTADPQRPAAGDTPPAFRLTARIDGPGLAEATALTDRAVALEDTPLASDEKLWIDRLPSIPSFQPMSDELAAWAEHVDRQQLRLPTRVSEASFGTEPSGFDTLQRDAFYWGWGQNEPPAGYFDAADGRRAVLVQLRGPIPSVASLRSSTPGDWAGRALAAGYAAVVVASRSASLSEVPFPRPFFATLRAGWTLAEAWSVAQAYPRGAYFLVGDPLLRVATPRAGWDLYGPLARMDEFDPDRPAAVLPDGVTEWPLTATQQPPDQQPRRYWVRHRDADGRPDGVTRPLTLSAVADAAVGVATAPAWPDRTGWTLEESGDSVAATLLFAAPPAAGELGSLELIDDRGGPSVAVTPPRRQNDWVRVSVGRPALDTRYRWRWTTPAGLVTTGPWSRAVRPAAAPTDLLSSWEARDES